MQNKRLGGIEHAAHIGIDDRIPLVSTHTRKHGITGDPGIINQRIDLLARVLQHARATAEYNVYYGRGRDAYDVRGRVAHEVLFNVTNGSYRGPSSQQGFSPFTTWTRGLAWAVLGFAEQLEFVERLGEDEQQNWIFDWEFCPAMIEHVDQTAAGR